MKQSLFYVTLGSVKVKSNTNLFAIIASDPHDALEKALKYGSDPTITGGPHALSSAWDISN